MARILVVDDDPSLRESIRRVLEKEGHLVDVAPEVESALEMLATFNFDLVISDLRMPGLSGIDLLSAIRRGSRRVPVVMVTAYGDSTATQEAHRLGACALLRKPIRRDTLLECTALALGGDYV